jgi:putative tricarboxylic transport membrane protein
LRNGLAVGEGKWSVFFNRPLTLSILVIAALVVVVPWVMKLRKKAAA